MSLSYSFPWIDGLSAKVSGSYEYSTSQNKNLNTPYSVMAILNGTWAKQSDPRGTASGINLGEGQSNYEQLVGGVDKIFGESSKKVQEYANQAFDLDKRICSRAKYWQQNSYNNT